MKPILFNTEMVKAILDGKKTVTRRVVKQDIVNQFDCEADGTPIAFIQQSTGDHYKPTDPCRYQPGDIIYVRETWRVGAWNVNTSSIAVDYKAGNVALKEWIYIEDEEEFERYWIQSTDDAERAGLVAEPFDGQYHWDAGKGPTRWRPSIHMPKEAARLFLKVTGVRVERLHDITCVDAEMEGVASTVYWTPNEMDNRPFEEKWWDDYHFWTHYPQIAFSRLWDSTISKSDINKYGWEANPYVWVISFERISKEEAI